MLHGLDEDALMRLNLGAEIDKVSELSKERQEMLVRFRPTRTDWKFLEETKIEG